MISTACPHCARPLVYDDHFANQAARCYCGAAFQIPDAPSPFAVEHAPPARRSRRGPSILGRVAKIGCGSLLILAVGLGVLAWLAYQSPADVLRGALDSWRLGQMPRHTLIDEPFRRGDVLLRYEIGPTSYDSRGRAVVQAVLYFETIGREQRESRRYTISPNTGGLGWTIVGEPVGTSR
jgi:hypothetical protein